jgi:hypothetical protein
MPSEQSRVFLTSCKALETSVFANSETYKICSDVSSEAFN